MPLQYAGVVEEHHAVRHAVGLFDVSHLGKLLVQGTGAADLVDATLTNSLSRIGPGRGQYTLCCTEEGGIVDDLLVYQRSAEELLLVPNAANAASVAARLAAAAPAGVTVVDRHSDFAVLAVQGPRSAELLTRLDLPADQPYLHFTDTRWGNVPVTVCRSGYTGERGFELILPNEGAGPLWDALLAAGAPLGVRPAGLAVRDVLRTEMGYPLHGADLTVEVTPVQARLGWAVGWDKPAFWGREALLAERARGPRRLLRGLRVVDRAIPRGGMAVHDETDGEVGRVTSGTFSPALGAGIGLALLAAEVPVGAPVWLDVRGRRATATVVDPPFVPARPQG